MADSRMFFNTQSILPLNHTAVSSQHIVQNGETSFEEILGKAQAKVSFSQHAQLRLQERNIHLCDKDMARLDAAVSKLAQKGARESLIYIGEAALVVSVTNRTVITAMDGTRGNENIITNIDSAAIL